MNTLNIKNLSLDYSTPHGNLKALRNVNFSIPKEKIVGLVGESGCGKSTLIAAILGLLPNNANIKSGEIIFQKKDLSQLSETQMKNILGVDISVVFQDPMQTHNPVITIGQQMMDIQYRDKINRSAKIQKALNMLTMVGISDGEHRLNQYPHEFSGGMRQRIAIAMALLVEPLLLIADEPTTALDATLEVEIIKLLQELQNRIGCSILFISHHLGVIAELCHDVVVMYAGEVVESGTAHDIFHSPAHPYSQALLACDPASIAKKTRNLPTIIGDIPDLTNLAEGCIFAERCNSSHDLCFHRPPSYTKLQGKHAVACHLHSEKN